FLATLGDRLALCRGALSFAGIHDDGVTFGTTSDNHVVVVEVDARGPATRLETFAANRLGDAIVRLYERYAEVLPDRPARTRAAATARTAAALVGPWDLDRCAAVAAPGVEFVDHRVLGFGSARGAERLLRGLRTMLEVADDVTNRVDDVLALGPEAC